MQAARFAFERPRRVDLVVGGPSFRVASTSEDDDWAINSGGYGFVPSIPDSAASVNLVAPVHGLPNGAVIQEFSCRFAQLQSSPTATFVFDLRRRDDFDFTPEGVAGVSGATFQTGAVVGGRAALSIEEPEVRDDLEYFITGRWDPTATGANVRFYGCVVSYEIAGLQPGRAVLQ